MNFKTVCFVLMLLTSAQITKAQSWLLAGNTANPASAFFGTTDNKAILFKTNNTERGRLLTNGNWQFGLTPNTAVIDASGKLSFKGTGGYVVAADQYIFSLAGSPVKGLYYNSANNQYQFLNSTNKGLLYVNTDNGNGGILGTFKIGAYTLPKTDGTSGQVLQTNGSGTVTWANAGGGSGNGWSLTGNAGTTPGTNFLGTTDNRILIFKTQNKEKMRIKTTGEVGIGTTTPQGTLNVVGTNFVSLTTPGYFQLGDSAGFNIGMDYGQIQARYFGGYANLYLNNYGGTTYLGSSANSYYGAIGYGSNYGLYGYAESGNGVYGVSYYVTGKGVYGYANGGAADAVHGEAVGSSDYGGYFSSATSFGLFATNNNASTYAGYFGGNVFSTGIYSGSDQKLKQNITDLASAMDIIGKLKPKTYNFRQDSNYKLMNLPQGLQYGLIAQDVEKVLPTLVKQTTFDVDRVTDHSDGKLPDPKSTTPPTKQTVTKTGEKIDFKALNYTELIPIMIKGMQEQQAVIDKQQQQIDELKQMVTSMMNNSSSSAAKINTANNAGAYLLQNAPNPFSQSTTIKCNVPAGIQTAQIVIFNSEGKQLKNYSLNNKGSNTITINAGSLSSGNYSYSLLLDGKIADTKTMVITK